MKRILIIGPGGAGKSTFARQLGARLGMEVLHLDRFYWKAGWIEPAQAEWLHTVEQLLARDSWIMDGNYSGTLAMRVEACDTLVFLDMPRLLCARRILQRAWKYRGRSRPDMAEGCPERVNLAFLGWIWNYHRHTRPKVLRLVQLHRDVKRVVHLRSPQEADKFLHNIGPG